MSEMIDPRWISQLYQRYETTLPGLRKRLGRALTLSEKILYSHLDTTENAPPVRGESYLSVRPDRVAMQDATAQMALLQLMLTGENSTAIPTTVHCDHLIRAYAGASADTAVANRENQEVYDFLRTVCMKYGIGFWKPGSGIIHQVLLENYATPGLLMIGTDSHTPNAGGLGMIAIGVGGADAMDVMAGLPWEVQCPKLIGIHLSGSFSGWTSPKDVILRICEILTTQGGTGRILEYFGPGAASISCTGKATITNMGAELGATTSVFPYDHRMATYLRATHRAKIADLADSHISYLTADPEVLASPEKYFDQIIEINLSTLEPYVVGPHSPDVARPISRLRAEAKEKSYPTEITVALIGSCTNSSYEDVGRATHIARQALQAGIRAKSKFMVTPGSEQIFETIKRDGYLDPLEAIGGVVLANACGPCIGQWKREDIVPNQTNTIFTSYNRNFPKRNDGNASTLAFIGSPEITTAMAIAGTLEFNPLTDTLTGAGGSTLTFAPPVAPELPEKGFVTALGGYVPPTPNSDVEVVIAKNSERLQALSPFAPWEPSDFAQLRILVKARGKCTTDHISPAGTWLKYRGHLERISDNLLLGAINAFTEEAGKGWNAIANQSHVPFSEIAKAYQQRGIGWVIVGDENYGEGSSREHAAMSPRYLGCRAVIARSFARIHETNLKKQGILPLTFVDAGDYEKITERDTVALTGLETLSPKSLITMVIHHENGQTSKLSLAHSLVFEQIAWWKTGSALNFIRKKTSITPC